MLPVLNNGWNMESVQFIKTVFNIFLYRLIIVILKRNLNFLKPVIFGSRLNSYGNWYTDIIIRLTVSEWDIKGHFLGNLNPYSQGACQNVVINVNRNNPSVRAAPSFDVNHSAACPLCIVFVYIYKPHTHYVFKLIVVHIILSYAGILIVYIGFIRRLSRPKAVCRGCQ